MLKYALLLVLPLFAQDALRGSWEAEFRRDEVHLNVRMSRGNGFSNWGRTYKLSELSDVVRNSDNITFKLTRPAGIFSFRGSDQNRDAGGTWTFTPNASYLREMDKLGYSDIAIQDLFVFGMCDLSVADAKYIEDATADRLTAPR